MEEAKPTAATVWQEYKDDLRNAGRLTETDVLLLRWLRPRWDGDFKLILDYPERLDLKAVAAILNRNIDIWQLLPYNFDLGFGEFYKLEGDFPVDAHNTDLGNATRLVARHGTALRFCHPWSKWLVWDGRRWKVDDTAAVVRQAKETVRSIYGEAAEAREAKDRKALAKHAMASEANTRVRAMLALAESEPGIPILPEDLDTDPWLLNVNNGTLNLKTGELLAHGPDLYITKLAPMDYDPTADCPLWLAFLDEVMAGDTAMTESLQRAVGYSLTGDISERALFLLHGNGANGKTTFLEVVRAMLGDYAQRIPTETLLVSKRNAGAATPDIARLKGARFVSASESEEGRRLAEAAIKDLTGGDTVTARFLYGRGFDFRPDCKIWLATNHKPTIRGTDRAIWDRIKLLPFEVTISEEKQDKHLADKLKAELPGILAWAVQGCLDWQRDGLGLADKVKKATAAYRAEMDVLAGFIEDWCIEGPDCEALAGDLLEAYKDWSGDKGINQTRFGRALGERGFVKEKKTTEPYKGRILWRGIGLIVEKKTVDSSEQISKKSASVGEDMDFNKKNPPPLSTVHSDDPVVQAALDLGGEMVRVETADGIVEMPF